MNGFVEIEEVEAVLETIGINFNNLKIAVAVSGGGDSMALAVLLNEIVKKHGGKLLALTVDHGLREESFREAGAVNRILSDIGIKHKLLKWEGEKPKTRVEEKAREARFNLLADECKKEGFEYLAVAHNLEDKAETFWMRLSHGSGLDGLASVAKTRRLRGINIIRPLLGFNREELRNTCRYYGIKWFEDPMNSDDKFLRVKLREFEKMLADEGLTPQRLDKTFLKLEEARQSIEFIVEELLTKIMKKHNEGYANINYELWKKYPSDIQRRILEKSLNSVYPQDYGTGFDLLEATRKEMLTQEFSGKTLSGCEIFFDKSGDIIICREAERVQGKVPLISAEVVWDKRYIVRADPDESIFVGALEEEGLAVLRKNKSLESVLEKLPYKIKRSIPAIWSEDGLMAVPLIGYYCPSCPNKVKNIVTGFVDNER